VAGSYFEVDTPPSVPDDPSYFELTRHGGIVPAYFSEVGGLASHPSRQAQQVTWSMAFVYKSPRLRRAIASFVGRTTSATFRRCASFSTSGITGSRPFAPVPTTSRRHCHGMYSSTETGV